MSLSGPEAMLLVIKGRLFLVSPAFQALLQLIAEPRQGSLLQSLLMKQKERVLWSLQLLQHHSM